jgi:hypothetical protein
MNRTQRRSVSPPGESGWRAAMDRLVSDDQLIMRVASADTVALEALFTRHQTRIFRFIARIVRDEAAAEELTNEVFVGGASAQGRAALTRPRNADKTAQR